jgi:hypothetical protein
MRILWIDDDYEAEKEHSWFGNIREQHEVQSVADFEEAYQKMSNQLEQLFFYNNTSAFEKAVLSKLILAILSSSLKPS